jgi:hypothetical protein
MNTKLSKPYDRGGRRLVAVLAAAMGLTLAWMPEAQATGNVQVSIVAGDLIIRGDGQSNNILVTVNGGGVCQVKGRANTTVNGEASCFIGDPVSGAIDIKMDGDDDFVRVEARPDLGPDPDPLNNPAAIPGDLRIDMGSGKDILELLQVSVAGETRITTGDGPDVVFVDGALLDRADTAFDTFIRSDFRGRVTLNTGDGNDFVEVAHPVFRDEVVAKLGGGNDGLCSNAAEYRNQDPGAVTFDGGSGVEFWAVTGPEPLSLLPAGALINFEAEDDDCSFNGGRP